MTSLLFVCLSSLLLLLMVMLFLLGTLLACRPYFIGVVENGHDSFEGRERWSIYPTSVLQPPVMFHFTTPNTDLQSLLVFTVLPRCYTASLA